MFFCQISEATTDSESPKLGWWNMGNVDKNLHPRKLRWHLKIDRPKRKLIFQPSMFRCYVSFREGIGPWYLMKMVVDFWWGKLPNRIWIPDFLKYSPWKEARTQKGKSSSKHSFSGVNPLFIRGNVRCKLKNGRFFHRSRLHASASSFPDGTKKLSC